MAYELMGLGAPPLVAVNPAWPAMTLAFVILDPAVGQPPTAPAGSAGPFTRDQLAAFLGAQNPATGVLLYDAATKALWGGAHDAPPSAGASPLLVLGGVALVLLGACWLACRGGAG